MHFISGIGDQARRTSDWVQRAAEPAPGFAARDPNIHQHQGKPVLTDVPAAEVDGFTPCILLVCSAQPTWLFLPAEIVTISRIYKAGQGSSGQSATLFAVEEEEE